MNGEELMLKTQLSKSFTVPGKTLFFGVQQGGTILLSPYGVMVVIVTTRAKTNLGMFAIDFDYCDKEDILQFDIE